ncbi:MAG: M48 family metallopeptidase [Sedimentisphaerales bacterium]|nr:M48 family metallopeptidase [Sedimentisphaerales bacterium]
MWEQIRVNKRNSLLLITMMALVLMGLGFVLGLAVGGPDGGWFGLITATVVWLVMLLFSFSMGDMALLASSRAKKVTAEVHPQLFNVVEEMTIAASLPKMPDIYIINDPAPNAFATGRNPEKASVAVTAGLLAKLNRDELQGVIAHEISHITNRDILFVTLAGVMIGTIVLLSQIFLRGMFYTGGRRRRYSSSSSSGSNQAQIIFLLIAILAAILAPIFANILYFALSRKREYLADAGAVRLTRYPEGLASALEKISTSSEEMTLANKVTAPMYISNPLRGLKAASLFSTHPPIQERIKILRTMSRGASFKDYSDSYSQTVGGKSIMPASALQDTEPVDIRQGSGARSESGKKQLRDIGDIMRKVNQFVFLTCTCGLKMKIPPNFKAPKVKCPRCGRISARPDK